MEEEHVRDDLVGDGRRHQSIASRNRGSSLNASCSRFFCCDPGSTSCFALRPKPEADDQVCKEQIISW